MTLFERRRLRYQKSEARKLTKPRADPIYKRTFPKIKTPENPRSGKLIATNDNIIKSFIENPKYHISETGIILSRYSRQGHLTEVFKEISQIDRKGYKLISYAGKKLAVHRIVYAKFVGKLHPDLVINHIDGNPANNSISNLELVTQSENNYHSFGTFGRRRMKKPA